MNEPTCAIEIVHRNGPNMLSIIAAVVIAICGAIVFCVDESRIALALSFVVLFCTCILSGNSCYLTELAKLERQKLMCILSMGLVCFQLCIASFRVRKYLDQGERFAVVTSITYLAAQLTLIYTLHSTRATLKKMNEEKPSAKPTGHQSGKATRHQSTTVWV